MPGKKLTVCGHTPKFKRPKDHPEILGSKGSVGETADM